MTLNRQLFTSTESIQRSEYEVTQMWQGAPLGLGVYVDNRVLPDRLQVLPAMPVPPPMFFPLPLFSALERVEPSSEAFLPTLDRFLASKGEHELLQQLEGSTAIRASDVLEKFLDTLRFSDLPERRKRAFRLLRSLCGSWGVLPTSYAFQGEVKLLDELPFAQASRFAEVFQGESGGKMVAVKVLSVSI